jgi:hypothetical protein
MAITTRHRTKRTPLADALPCDFIVFAPAQVPLNLMISSVRELKPAADQGHAVAQFHYGCCLQKGEGVSIDFQGAA